MHLVCSSVNAHPQTPQHKVFHWGSLHIPKTSVPPWICLQNCSWLKAKLLLVSGLVVFCCRKPTHLNPTQLRSHNITWDCIHSSSPGRHTLAKFPPHTEVSSQASKEPVCDNDRSGQSGCSNFTSTPQHFWIFFQSLQIRHCCLTKLQPWPVLLKVSRKANPLFINEPIVFLFQAKHLDGAFLAVLLQFSLFGLFIHLPVYLSRPLIFHS